MEINPSYLLSLDTSQATFESVAENDTATIKTVESDYKPGTFYISISDPFGDTGKPPVAQAELSKVSVLLQFDSAGDVVGIQLYHVPANVIETQYQAQMSAAFKEAKQFAEAIGLVIDEDFKAYLTPLVLVDQDTESGESE